MVSRWALNLAARVSWAVRATPPWSRLARAAVWIRARRLGSGLGGNADSGSSQENLGCGRMVALLFLGGLRGLRRRDVWGLFVDMCRTPCGLAVSGATRSAVWSETNWTV